MTSNLTSSLSASNLEMPIESKISFFKVHEMLKKIAAGDNRHEATFAQSVLKEVEPHKELIEGTTQAEVIFKNKQIVNQLVSLLFPSILSSNEIKAAATPFQFDFFYQSKRFQKIIKAAGKDFQLKISELDSRSMFMMSCVTILEKFYGYDIHLNKPITLEMPNLVDQNTRYYRCAFNADLMEVIPTKKSLKITKADYFELLNNYDDLAVWQKKFPAKSYIMRGVGLINLIDVTVSHSLNLMTSNLLRKGSNSFNEVSKNMNHFLGKSDLLVSFIGVDQDYFVPLGNFPKDTILLNGKERLSKTDSICEYGEEVLFHKHKPYVIIDTEIYSGKNENILVEQLAKKDIQSYLLAPLIHDERFIGFLEIGSKRKEELNAITLENLKLAIPILSMAAARYIHEKNNAVESIIQKEFTRVHPSVKWRFKQAAEEILSNREKQQNYEVKDLEFHDVYPLYGQIDVRSSSTKRNHAVGKDLSTQLKKVKSIIQQAITNESLPSYEQMIFQIDEFLKDIELGILEGSEQKVLNFLQHEIYTKFDYFKENFPYLKKKIEAYEKLLDPNKGLVYNERKNFDESIQLINKKLAAFIDEKQQTAQKMFPHYFERFKTDGVEYNLYIGQSIAENRKFNAIHLDNLQLWQLKTMCEMERLFNQFKNELPMDLEVASMILLFNTPLNIQFRLDEKKFDVDGAYNARYEIVKKRIDKAFIKNSNKRITEPGKICIVYSNKSEANAYYKHIQFMEAKGLILKDSLEHLDVEDLQGTSGLKAMRVSVNYENLDRTGKNEVSSYKKEQMD